MNKIAVLLTSPRFPFFLQLALFLFGFLVGLLSVGSLECNVKYCVDDQCFAPETQKCPDVGDCGYGCRTLTYTYQGNRYIWGNCSSRCDSDFCLDFETDWDPVPATVSDCALTCCYTDLCNEQGEYKN